jgi:hypothetical protein
MNKIKRTQDFNLKSALVAYVIYQQKIKLPQGEILCYVKLGNEIEEKKLTAFSILSLENNYNIIDILNSKIPLLEKRASSMKFIKNKFSFIKKIFKKIFKRKSYFVEDKFSERELEKFQKEAEEIMKEEL